MLKKCCFCVPLQAGVKIIAVFGAVYYLMLIVFAVLGLVDVINEQKDENHNAIAVGIGVVIIFFGCFLTCILLYYGAHKERRIFIVPYLIIIAVTVTLDGCHYIYKMVAMNSAGRNSIASLISYVVLIYCWICVLSYYKSLPGSYNAGAINEG